MEPEPTAASKLPSLRACSELNISGIRSAQPLWKRVPTKDASGQLLSDCMFIIDGLKRQSIIEQQSIASTLQETLADLGPSIVFAELNLKLGLLWVSFPSQKGLFIHIVDVVQSRLPQAKVISNKAEVQIAEGRQPRRWWF